MGSAEALQNEFYWNSFVFFIYISECKKQQFKKHM